MEKGPRFIVSSEGQEKRTIEPVTLRLQDQHDKIILLILSRVNREVGRKREIPEQKHLTTHKENLACLTCDSC